MRPSSSSTVRAALGSPAEPRGTRPALAPSSLLRAFDASAGKDAPDRPRSRATSGGVRPSTGEFVAGRVRRLRRVRSVLRAHEVARGRTRPREGPSRTRASRIRDGSRGSSRDRARSPSFDVERGVGRDGCRRRSEIAIVRRFNFAVVVRVGGGGRGRRRPPSRGPRAPEPPGEGALAVPREGAQRAVRAARAPGSRSLTLSTSR